MRVTETITIHKSYSKM